jgi:murein L,D-transpeptidase YcbB/YkuD
VALALTAPPRPLDRAAAPLIAPTASDQQVAGGLRAILSRTEVEPDIAQFYRRHGYRSLWTTDEGLAPSSRTLLAALGGAWRDGLDPDAYVTPRLRASLAAAGDGRPESLARAELALSRTYATYASDLRNGPSGPSLAFVDPAFGPSRMTRSEALERAADSPVSALAELDRFNPVYASLRSQLGAPGPWGWTPYQNLIRINLDRVRRFPAADRFVLVDAASQRLQLYEQGRPQLTMNVGVGRIDEPTPEMAAVIRWVDFRPYWNVPPDLVRKHLAPKVIRDGPAALDAAHMEALSGWDADARVIDASSIDWQAVADGRQPLRVRQRPGPDNVLGALKFMLPNPLGVYLHDTSRKALLIRERRNVSAGCVRLADAMLLARRLMPDAKAPPGSDPEARVDLPEPTPVYITYLTLAPVPWGLERRSDAYGRDAKLLARLERYDRAARES